MTATSPRWPALEADRWRETRDTLHLMVRVKHPRINRAAVPELLKSLAHSSEMRRILPN